MLYAYIFLSHLRNGLLHSVITELTRHFLRVDQVEYIAVPIDNRSICCDCWDKIYVKEEWLWLSGLP